MMNRREVEECDGLCIDGECMRGEGGVDIEDVKREWSRYSRDSYEHFC